MGLSLNSEKQTDGKNTAESRAKAASITIVLCQHGLLWCARFIIGGTVYVVSRGALATDLMVSESLLLASSSIAPLYLGLHNASALARRGSVDTEDKRAERLRRGARISLRISVTIWLVACGVASTFTIARHPSCSLMGNSGSLPNLGSACIVQRTTVGASLLALILSIVLFILIRRTRKPFRCHLFGIVREEPGIPIAQPYKQSVYRNCPRPMFSETSFKCRSSSTLSSSRTLVPMYEESTTTLLSKQPAKAIGLGISTTRTSMPSFLAPRPSLSSIRSHASIHLPPPQSPLPPLPAYFPGRYKQSSMMQRAIHPTLRPQRPQRPRRPSNSIVGVVPPSPALSIANLQAFNKSAESLSSVYSRSVTGERYGYPRSLRRAGALAPASRTTSSSSTATVKKSPLAMMRLASDPEIIVTSNSPARSSSGSSSSDSDIDDVATLHARLQSVKAVSDFGKVPSEKSENGGVCADVSEVLPNLLGGDEEGGLHAIEFDEDEG